MLLVDIAGRFHRSGANLSVTTGGVAIAAERADYVRSLLPPRPSQVGAVHFETRDGRRANRGTRVPCGRGS